MAAFRVRWLLGPLDGLQETWEYAPIEGEQVARGNWHWYAWSPAWRAFLPVHWAGVTRYPAATAPYQV